MRVTGGFAKARWVACWLLFACLLWPGASGVAAAAERAGLLFSPQESLRARFDTVRRAQSRITISTFSVNPDEAGLALLEELAQKARAGVKVRLLMDGVSHRRDKGKIHDVLQYLDASGVEIREFMSATSSARLQRAVGLSGFAAEKLHAKVMIGDDIAVSGGRNLNNQGLKGGAPGAHDVDAIFSGSAVSAAQDYLDALWDSPETTPLRFPADEAGLRRGQATLAKASAWMHDAGIIDPLKPSDPLKLTKPVRRVRFLHDGVGAGKGPSATARELQGLFGAAQKEVLLSNHTANLTDGFWGAFTRARRNGAKVDLITNAEDRYPGGAKEGRWDDYVRSYKKFADRGVSLRELRDRASLHAKVAVVDGKQAVVSSFNLEPASEYLNKETAIVVDDEELAGRLKSYIERHRSMARPVVQDGRILAPTKAPFSVDCGTAFRLLQRARGFR
jgi:putative cardiolipin synthase